MVGHGEKLSRLKTQAALALLSSSTHGKAAAKVGVSVATIRRWLKDDDFRAELVELNKRLATAGIEELTERVAGRVDRRALQPA